MLKCLNELPSFRQSRRYVLDGIALVDEAQVQLCLKLASNLLSLARELPLHILLALLDPDQLAQ
jgi:hypothetical protein